MRFSGTGSKVTHFYSPPGSSVSPSPSEAEGANRGALRTGGWVGRLEIQSVLNFYLILIILTTMYWTYSTLFI